MYLEEKVDHLISEQKRLVEMIELFLPNLESEKGVIHFLEITKNTFNTYLKDEVFQENIHYVRERKKYVFIPEEIVKLKKNGVKGRRKNSNKDKATIDTVNTKLGIISECRHVV